MIQPIEKTYQGADWQNLLANAITDPLELLQLLGLEHYAEKAAFQAIQQFPLRVPRGFVARMEKGNIHDPLLKQVLPLGKELLVTPGYTQNPLHEDSVNPLPGLLHKYHGRVLLTVTGACAVNCRYCFRRHFSYADNMPGTKGWDNVIEYIAADETITEVIYSGGDPLLAKDAQLAQLTQKIAAVKHVKRLRIHTRLPVVLPERITTELINSINNTRLQTVVVLHSNHGNEIDETVAAAVQRLRAENITVFNQTVLLKGINDSVPALIQLSEKLFSAGVLPYYLHLLDKVQGAAHFEVDEEIAKNLVNEMIKKLPGYLVPKLVREIPKKGAKQAISLV